VSGYSFDDEQAEQVVSKLEQVADEPVRDATKPDMAKLRGLWYVDPARYRAAVKHFGLEPSDIWPTKAQLPENDVLHGYPAGAFGLTLPEFDGKARAKGK
jgi:hypothetical protein